MGTGNIPPYCYKKKYIMEGRAIYLVNEEPAGQYIDEKVKALIFAKSTHDIERTKREILKEFKEIYEYDLKTADMPEPFGTFVDEEERKCFIERNQLVADFLLYLGNIFCIYHTALVQMKKIPLIECEHLVIDYTELYHRAAGEYFATLSGIPFPFQICCEEAQNKMIYKPNHACGTTFILPALIEHFLLTELQNRILFAGLDAAQKLTDNGNIVLEDDEKNLLNKFLYYRNKGGGEFGGKQEDTMEIMYRIFVKNGIIEDSMDNHKILTGIKKNTKTTLGSLLHSDYAQSVIRPEYFNLISVLFDAKKMNIRNCITHGNSTVYDYLSIEIAAVMMQLLWDISDKSAFFECK